MFASFGSNHGARPDLNPLPLPSPVRVIFANDEEIT